MGESNGGNLNSTRTSINIDNVDKKDDNAKDEKPGKIRKIATAICNSTVVKWWQLSEHPLPETPSLYEKARWYFLCPPHSSLGWLLTRMLGLFISWGALYGLVGEKEAETEGNIFILYVTSRLAGFLVTKLKLPALLGMLLAGIVLNNLTSVPHNIDDYWKEIFRDIAFITILIRAGLSLSPKGLIQLKNVVIRLALCPGVLAEGPVVALVAWLLIGLPFDWSLMLGFILAAVSPAVVVPSLLGLQAQGYGVEQGVPTLIIAAASIDDIIAISAFSVSLSITFADGHSGGIVLEILRAPVEVLIGIAAAFVLGIILWYIPPPAKNEVDKSGHPLLKQENHTTARFLLLFGGGIMFMFGARKLDLSGAGALGTLAVAFVTGLGWDMKTKMPVGEAFGHAWNSLMPLLFALIGSEIDIKIIDPHMIGWAIAVIMCGLIVRFIITFLVVFGAGMNIKEQLFVAIAWIPKATVQAAMGSIPLDNARRRLSEAIALGEDVEGRDKLIEMAEADKLFGEKVITVAVLAILISAPLGAIGISMTGQKLLQRPRQWSRRSMRRNSNVTKSDGLPRPLKTLSANQSFHADSDEESHLPATAQTMANGEIYLVLNPPIDDKTSHESIETDQQDRPPLELDQSDATSYKRNSQSSKQQSYTDLPTDEAAGATDC